MNSTETDKQIYKVLEEQRRIAAYHFLRDSHCNGSFGGYACTRQRYPKSRH